MKINDQLNESLKTGYIDQSIISNKDYLPQLVVNDKSLGKKVLTTILKELNSCDEFWFSVAFVTTEGVATLINTLNELRNRGIKGKILVSQYLNFTQPEALKRLLQFENIDLKIAVGVGFHSKGFLFKKGDVYDLIIGSSNLTASALCSNIEWNLKITATPISHIIFNAIKEFSTQFECATSVNIEFIAIYNELYKKQLSNTKRLSEELSKTEIVSIKPNLMQVEALENLEALRRQGKKKALLISATGTGKTYLSAFDAQKTNPKKLLFVVHRRNIAEAAKRTFERVFGNTKSTGIFSGNEKVIEADFIFSTVQTISKKEYREHFDPSHFDYIIIDESHRAGADSYQQLLEYFTPSFLLGMTATPERTDGLDIFKLYDYNIAYEIRLHRALEENILSPFHYYGVTDITVEGNLLNENSDFRLLTSNERIDRVIEQSNFFGCDSGILRGLVFCSSVQECKELSIGFNQRGFRTIALTGANSENERDDAISLLEHSDESQKLDYIFTVDIFNEGIDIPSVNQVIMLRPTQSAIVFVQQLGRGLRKTEGKEYLTVIDFIGNYSNNFLVPIALYGDTTFNKDTLRKLIVSESSSIPGTSTINFDRITKEKIFESIDSANMTLKKDLINDYKLLKYKIGRVPMMLDFLEHGSRDPFLYVNYSRSYFNFAAILEDDLKGTLNVEEIKLLELFSSEINNSKRVEESIILLQLIRNGEVAISTFISEIENLFGYIVSQETIDSCILNLNFDFIRNSKKVVESQRNILVRSEDLVTALKNSVFKSYLLDSTEYSIRNFKRSFEKTKYVNGFIRYHKYSRKDVCRILNWPIDISSTIYGYRTKEKSTPLFVTYHKAEDISESTKYNDHFIDQNTFAWETRPRVRIDSKDVINLKNSNRVLLFVKKEDGEGSDFYFIGDVRIIDGSIEQQKVPNSETPIVHLKYSLDFPVDDGIYNYITDSRIKEMSESIEVNSVFLPFKVLEVDKINQFINCIPLYDIKAAAGNFSDLQINEETKWVELLTPIKYSSDYFVCQVLGESMNKTVPNNSWCLFKKDKGGSRNGKVVLVQHSSIQENDFGSGYTLKRYESQKQTNDESWEHVKITLHPNSTDSSYEPIQLENNELEDLRVIGIFERVLK